MNYLFFALGLLIMVAGSLLSEVMPTEGLYITGFITGVVSYCLFSHALDLDDEE